MKLQKKHINIEFFDESSIENIITCLHYKMDKVIFFGYENNMTKEKKKNTEVFLKEKCKIEECEFKVVEKYDLEQILEQIDAVVKEEQNKENLCYFDLTGGEDLILVSFGMLAQKYQLPIHEYDVENDELISFNNKSEYKIDTAAQKHNIKLNLDDILVMQGGSINYGKQKSYKANVDEEHFKKDIMAMWKIAKDNSLKWNVLSAVFKDCKKYTNAKKMVVIPEKEWEKIIESKNSALDLSTVQTYLEQLENIKVMTFYKNRDGIITYSFKNESIEMCILDAGCLLELVTYYDRKNKYRGADVRIGVHLDWDGIIEKKNVENEIDVMVLDKNIPRFISCKNGEVTPVALYELDAIAKEMGGKYAKKELVTSTKVSGLLKKRAKQMDIVVSTVS